MSQWTWVAYDKLDLALTSPLGVLSDAEARQALVPWDGAGSGSFVINRHSAQAGWCETRNYITVHIGDENDPAVFGFFIEEGQDEIVSAAEEGGEDFKRGGRGALVYLERAIVDHVQRTANAFTIDDDKMNLVWEDKAVGRIFRDLVDEAQARTPNPLPDITVDFTNSLDSNGDPWDTVDGEFNIPIGLDLLSAIETLKGQGLSVVMDPDFTLHGYQDWDPPSSGVTFEKGVNIREAAARDVHATTAKSRLLVQGTRASGATIYKTSTDPTVEAAEGVFEGFFRYNRNATVARLEKAGQRRLRALKRMHDGMTTVGVTVGDGTGGARGTGAGHYVPFTDYTVGELITLEVPGEYDALTKMLGGIVLEDTEAGEYDVSVQFDVPDFNPSIGELAPGGGKDFAGDQPPGVEGGGPATPTEPAETVIGSCVTFNPRTWLRRVGPSGEELELGGLIMLYVGSHVANNSAWSVTACPIGGGGWDSWEDRQSWYEFTAPADDPEFLGMILTVDATGAWTSGEFGGYLVGIAPTACAPGEYDTPTTFATGIIGGTMTVYIPRSHILWGGVNAITLTPSWECARNYFTCNGLAYFGNPLGDGRGSSGGAYDILPQNICTVAFVDGTTGPTAEGVAAYGDVDGVNRTFTLIDWDGTGTPEVAINGVEQSTLDVDYNRTTGTATLPGPPPAGSVVLWKYMVGALPSEVTLTPEPVAIILLVPAPNIPQPIYLLPDPVALLLTAPEPTVTY